ncbi:DUF4160 domain-containing protein [Azospirillum sp. RWY-5-1]|uniref:DUF4160 domain-containing protein n=1 Tax=Azospirillum oleiclasticum TaxID=2735135 RepID=A0ABX2TDM8_9PROT|nr:DUF4160 domain-containing protein [Azospirillum oleiclasticum]NYZ22378.1 DUF4160 domain-containing protein [Azospirillum oleiclasticum]
MPTIAEFDGIRVLMYYRDHEPPHFHVEYGDREALVRIADLAVIEGDVPSRILRRAIDWARDRQGALALNWVKCRSHVAPDRL